MAIPFGFSAGDFVAAGQLLTKIIQNLKCSKPEQQSDEAIAFLETARQIFNRLETLDPSDGSIDVAGVGVLHEHARACHTQLEEINTKATNYQHAFGNQGTHASKTGEWARHKSKKILWTLSAKDVEEMKRTLGNHISSMGVLLLLQQGNIMKKFNRDQLLMLQGTHDMQSKMDILLRSSRMLSKRAAVERITDSVLQDDKERNGPGKAPLALQKRNSFVELLDANTLHQGVESLVLSLYCFWRVLRTFIRAISILPRGPAVILDAITLEDRSFHQNLSLPFEHFRYLPVLMSRLQVYFSPDESTSYADLFNNGNFHLAIRDGSHEQELDESSREQCIRPGSQVSLGVFSVHACHSHGEIKCDSCGAYAKSMGHSGDTNCSLCMIKCLEGNESPAVPISWDSEYLDCLLNHQLVFCCDCEGSFRLTPEEERPDCCCSLKTSFFGIGHEMVMDKEIEDNTCDVVKAWSRAEEIDD